MMRCCVVVAQVVFHSWRVFELIATHGLLCHTVPATVCLTVMIPSASTVCTT